MKKLYTTPIAFEEVFLANSYVARCQTSITSIVTSTGMQCINPKHTNHQEGEYFSNLWVMGDKGTCEIIVDNDSVITEGRWSLLSEFKPNSGAIVYASDGKTYAATEIYTKGLFNSFYVPSFVNANNDGGMCYGAYRNKGETQQIVGEPVFS